MFIYEHTTQVTVVGGSISSETLRMKGGLLRHFLVRANTDTTMFKVSLINDRNVNVLDYGFHTSEINDWNVTLPVQG